LIGEIKNEEKVLWNPSMGYKGIGKKYDSGFSESERREILKKVRRSLKVLILSKLSEEFKINI
jgi:hypothetical protein